MRSLLRALMFHLLALPSSEDDLRMEILALRHQVQAFKKAGARPRLGSRFRLYWILLSRLWPRWKAACVLVKPETVVRWHRAGFRQFWRWKSRKPSCPRTRKDLIALIRMMATSNPSWGAPRIHGELLKLGFRISPRTVSRFMPKRTYQGDDLQQRRQTWKAFLLNHREVISAMDFLVVSSWRFQPLYILVILDHGRRMVRHFNVTANPTAEWLRLQLREAFPFDSNPRYLIHDNDTIFSGINAFLEPFGMKDKRTAFHSPWQNGACERILGTLRRELLDHVIPMDEQHLRRLIKEYLRYYHEDRTHLGLDKDSPRGRPLEPMPDDSAKVESLSRCGGLHHRYCWRAAA